MVTDFLMPSRNPALRVAKDVRLSPREAEVLTWTAEGKTCFEISLMLNIAEETVRTHVKNACQRLDAANKVQAVAVAMTLGLIVPFTSVKISAGRNPLCLVDSKTALSTTEEI